MPLQTAFILGLRIYIFFNELFKNDHIKIETKFHISIIT